MASSTGASDRPRGVSRYSTVGGLVEITTRSIRPADSRSRSRSASMRGEIPPTASANSLKRSAPLTAANRIDSSHRRSGTGSHLRQRDIAGGLERAIEHLVDGHDRVERHLLAHLFGDVVEVAAIAL